eukprot:TRINITY_DN545_c0_g1_i1.p1 TRINITY_DN545_c0_g1~~TRINITY_DN545_c0_g1_i1.p1  ORF type:complete len:213 (+),score=77.43 TRINITY_DN545_c0_g1_i1:152-790(+)
MLRDEVGKCLTRISGGGGCKRAEEEQEEGTQLVAQLLGVFDSSRECSMDIATYAERLVATTSHDPDTLRTDEGTLACILLCRVQQRMADLHSRGHSSGQRYNCLHSINIHRLFLAALLVAKKLLTDFPDPRALAAMSARGGISTHELAHLEVLFLFAVGFNLYISPDEFLSFVKENSTTNHAAASSANNASSCDPCAGATPAPTPPTTALCC